MPEVLLDTDILSNLMRKQPAVVTKARAYLAVHGRLSFSIITRYEVLRGLKAKGATAQEARFNVLCSRSRILPLTDAVVVAGAEIYAALRKRGEAIGDADILIAATALVDGLVLNTNNEVHFKRIDGLPLTNWLREDAFPFSRQ